MGDTVVLGQAAGRWCPYVREDGDGWPCAPAGPDPVTALTGAWGRRRRKGEEGERSRPRDGTAGNC
ncbi:hypothetical protein C1I97_05895 [Streptomyces sp. NTH33]|nr:hypothetical protein C1I97_05895 [Streptomyces sp. NTH33]